MKAKFLTRFNALIGLILALFGFGCVSCVEYGVPPLVKYGSPYNTLEATGKVTDEDIAITDQNAQTVADKLFAPPGTDRPKIALQLFLYDFFAHQDPAFKDKTLVNSIYSTARLYTQPLKDQAESPAFSELVKEKLARKLDELTDPSVPFRRTEDPRTCQWCDFKMICGR